MRRFCLKLAPFFFAAALISCEDGPKQQYAPPPAGANQLWNNGDTPAVVPADQGQQFTAAYPTTGKTTICSTDLKRQRWSWMLNQPVIPPRQYAGIDMAKDDLWHGLTIDEAEAPPATDPNMPGGGLCQSVPQGFIGACPSGFGNCNQNIWGNNGEVQFVWNLATHKVDQMLLNLGYLGDMRFKSRDGRHTYSIKIGDVIKKDDMPFLIHWDSNPAPQITELYNAAIATFGPAAGLAADADSPNCQADGNCLVFNGQGQTIFGFRRLVIYVQGIGGVPQPQLSTPILFYNFFAKFEPYGNLPQVVKLDAEGPVAKGTPIGARDPSMVCEQKVGIKFGDYKKNCVQVHGPANAPDMIDQVNLNKIENGLQHDQEHWTANVIGVNQNFTSNKTQTNPDMIVLDEDTPQDNDLAQDWFFDLRARGHTRNDYNSYGNPPAEKLDLRGSAMVYTEWARLMLADVNRLLKKAGKIPANQPPKRLGDPTCTGFDAMGNPNFAPGCSGLEGLIIPGNTSRGDFTKDASCANPATCLDPGGNWDLGNNFYGASILKPGDIIAGFCQDPGAYTDCLQIQSPWFTATAWVVRLMGKGNINNLPEEMRDRRYYFRFFAYAFVKYLKAYSDFADNANVNHWPCSSQVDPTCTNGGLGPTDVMNQYIDKESLFFDNNEQGGSNGFDKFEYIDRENIGKGQEGTDAASYNWIPWDFEYGVDLIGGNQRYDNYYRRMDREEIALYSAMTYDKTKTPAAENFVNITNLFGSPLLPSVWPDYQCATGTAGDPVSNECFTCLAPLAHCPNAYKVFIAPPIDVTNMTTCTPTAACDGSRPCHGTCGSTGGLCTQVKTWENGTQMACGTPCDFTANPQTGCALPNQACVASQFDAGATESCMNMVMDLNGATGPNPHPILYYYPSAWSRSPFGVGHSPIAVHAADKHPDIGVAKVSLPNFKDGPSTPSPMAVTSTTCPANWTLSPTGHWCSAPLDNGSGMHAANFTALTPWLEVQPGVGFSFPLDGQHDQVVTTAQLDYTGVLETYVVDYIPWVDTHKPSCIADDPKGMACNKGYTCDPTSRACVASDDTIQILAIESADFLGEAFVCQDPKTGDVLHVRQFDSAVRIVQWFANHPGGWDPASGQIQPSAQAACSVIFRYSPYNNYLDYITSKAYGVKLSINQGAGLGRVVDVTLYDPGITNAP